MERVIKYKCVYCGNLFDSKDVCQEHETRHKKIDRANQMLDNGCTLKEIQDECNIWYKLPEHLENVTKHNCFIVSHWQGCVRPAYQITDINFKGSVWLHGCGSYCWGSYGKYVGLHSIELINPRPEEELFIAKNMTGVR